MALLAGGWVDESRGSFARCLEKEGVEYVFGVPGEEVLQLVDSISSSGIRLIATRHEQGAAFMADVYGRLTGRAGVCLSTLGPGATNLVTGVADANMDMAPLGGYLRAGPDHRLHKQSHQVIDLVRLFEPITKYGAQVRTPRTIPEIVRKAFKVAEAESPGACFIELPQDVAEMDVEGLEPLRRQSPRPAYPDPANLEHVAAILEAARAPLVMAGHGVIRMGASAQLVAFAETLNIPVVTTFMAKGAMPASHQLFLGAAGLQSHDYDYCGFAEADLIICVGYDMVEYHPYLWRRDDQKLVHIHATAAEVDEHYVLDGGLVCHIGAALDALRERCRRHRSRVAATARGNLLAEIAAYADDPGHPLKPQKIINDIRAALDPDDILISDVGAHKMWAISALPGREAQHLDRLQRLRRHGHRPPGSRGRGPHQSGQGHPGRDRRRGVHAQFARARDGRPAWTQFRGAHMERLFQRVDRVEAGLPTGTHELCKLR